MAPNTSPGSDGLPAEFYKQFVLSALNFAHAEGCLSIMQRRGLITLVPKKSKPANLLKKLEANYSPELRL